MINSIDDLIEQKDGKQVEVAGSPGAKFQCVDLVNLYIRDVLGLPIIEWTNAKDFPSRAGDAYDYIKNTEKAIIKRGDIPVWNGYVGRGCGHIAVCIQDGDLNSFVSFDQNWSTPLRCKIEGHTYLYVKGWLRKKGGNVSNELAECLKQHTKLVDECNAKTAEIKELQKTVSSQAIELTDFRRSLKSWIDKLNEAVANFENADRLRGEWYTKYVGSQKNFGELKIENQVMRTKIAMIENTSFESASTKDLVGEVLRRLFGIEKPLSGA